MNKLSLADIKKKNYSDVYSFIYKNRKPRLQPSQKRNLLCFREAVCLMKYPLELLWDISVNL